MRVRTGATLVFAGLMAAACDTQKVGEPTNPGEIESVSSQLGLSGPLGPQLNFHGLSRAATTTGTYDDTGPFFQKLGTNDRACVTCHQVGEGFTITPLGVQWRFYTTDGTDPLFLPHDAANSPNADVSTFEAREQAYSLMLERAVVRIGLPVKPTSEFELAVADDPYGFASATQLSLFRRPLSVANLKFATSVNWDGRNVVAADPQNIRQGLKNQSNGATVNHAKAAAPIADAIRDQIVDFETSLLSAQVFTFGAGSMTSAGATGGPDALLTTPFAFGLNAPGPGFNPNVFTLFDSWQSSYFSGRRDVYEGQQIFNTRTFAVTLPGGAVIQATCSGCHSLPNVGGSSTFQLFDVGVSAAERRAPNVPLYTLRHKVTGDEVQTTDPGRALVSGLWADMNKFKVPVLRGLSARPPYFHDGSAGSLEDVVNHYNQHFNIGFSSSEKRKLTAFLEAL